MEVSKKYVNIYAERGKNTEETLRLNREVDRILIKQSVANLATAFRCTGGTPENEENPITLKGYTYDDGDFYVSSDGVLRSRNAIEKWSRYVWNNEPNKLDGYSGHIIRTYYYDTLNQETLCAHAITELKKICDTEINYEIDINTLPENIKIGDRINIVDDAGELYLSSRILKLETSISDNSQKATIGEHLIKDSGISLAVAELAGKFAEVAKSAERAKQLADAAKDAANNAQTSVENVEKDVENLETTVSNTQQAAENATAAATESQAKANEAMQAAANAIADAAAANAAVEIAQSAASSALSKAETAQSEANTAKSEAQTAQATAEAAKKDAQKASEEIATLGDNLDTVSQKMTADYARKTDLTQATASLQTQITQNAAEISSTASKVMEIDETANNAAEQAAQAKAKADEAKTNAQAAQSTADTAKTNAATAQSKADAAAQAAQTAQTAADEADAKAAAAASDLATAKSNLAAVTSRVGATEAEIAEAEAAVAAAQAAADSAAAAASTAQSTANTAKNNAATAQTAANNAKTAADNAQKAADDAQDAADAAQAAVDSLTTRVTSAETKITQNSEQIALRATKAEVTQTLGGYYNKTQTDALIKVEADKITSQASKIDGLTSRVSTVEQTAEGLTVSLQTTNSNVSTAQSTANSASSAASAAQTTANTANTTADSVKTDLANNYTKKTLPDTRSTNQNPQWYITNYPKQIITEFKQASVIGLSGETYCTLETTVPWNDTSGGYPKQVAKIGGKEYWRIGTSTTAWGAWNDALGTASTARTEAANAAKTATNYLNFSNSGLVIGDMTASTLGRNVLIDSDSVDIRNGTTVLASFGANLIELGKNSADATIKLCGGKGEIVYDRLDMLGSDSRLIVKGNFPTLYGGANPVAMMSQAGSADYCYVKVSTNQIELMPRYGVAQSNGTVVMTGSEMRVSTWDIYGLADEVQFVSRNDLILQSVAGDITIPAGNLVTTERINANGGLRLANGGQITGNTNSGQEITMVQMNADNYTMFGYGGYVNSIGRTYLDGNDVYIRSKGVVDVTGTLTINNPATLGNGIPLRWKDSSGTLRNIFYLGSSNNLIFGYGMYEAQVGNTLVYAGNTIKLATPSETLNLEPSTSTSYTAHFYPKNANKCTLGTSNNAWYRLYASVTSTTTSDRRKKENIIPIGINQLMPSSDGGPDIVVDLYSELFDRLLPVQYNLIDGNGRKCFGLIAQDVIESMHEIGIGEDELDLVYHEFWKDENGDETDSYSIAYENLIAVLIHEVQKLKAEVKTLKGA